MAANEWKWYVYELCSPDGVVFYVGKGTRNRIDRHEEEAKAGIQSHKCNKIRQIWDGGGNVIKNKVAFFCDEQLAYIHEADRIAEYGLPNLTNVVLSTTLVTNKNKSPDGKQTAYEMFKKFSGHYAFWLRNSENGEKKVTVSGVGEWTKSLYETLYNSFIPKTFKLLIKSDKYREKVVEELKRHNVNLVFTSP